MLKGVIYMFKNNLHISSEKQSTIYNSLKKEGTNYFSNYLLLILSSLIATIGLLKNNNELIIGAMLTSPIMTIILCNSLCLIVKDKKTFYISANIIIIATLISIFVAILVSSFYSPIDITKEIISRTHPSITDLIVAGAAGLASTYTKCHNDKASILSGTAIAVSLIPPLCVTGITFAYKNYSMAFDALKLYMLNLIGIILISTIIFKLIGFKPK
jgi:uncharacterized hydrophobic protein (TIGR00271 family)